MNTFNEYLDSILDANKKQRLASILHQIKDTYPFLQEQIKWNQPMFCDHGTFIIGFSVAKVHISVAPEAIAIKKFANRIESAGYTATKELFRIRWTDEVDDLLINDIIHFNVEDKKGMKKFWR